MEKDELLKSPSTATVLTSSPLRTPDLDSPNNKI